MKKRHFLALGGSALLSGLTPHTTFAQSKFPERPIRIIVPFAPAGDGDIIGRVTSISWSPNVGRHIGLAFVPPEMTTPGTALSIRVTDGSMVPAEVCTTPFFDPTDARQKEAT